jgi:hypothetical protein
VKARYNKIRIVIQQYNALAFLQMKAHSETRSRSTRPSHAVGQGTSFDLFFPVREERRSIVTDASEQLDRWADEGGAIIAPRAVPPA